MRRNNRSQAGDTIVEVLVCVALLGAVIGAAYATASRNMLINQASQERLAGMKVAESQLERLRAKASTAPDTVFGLDNFCLAQDGQSATAGGDTGPCRVDASGAYVSQDPSYRIVIQKEPGGEFLDANSVQYGQRYTITVSWANVRGTTDRIVYTYGVYR